jgi:hypothetical protein
MRPLPVNRLSTSMADPGAAARAREPAENTRAPRPPEKQQSSAQNSVAPGMADRSPASSARPMQVSGMLRVSASYGTR